MADAGRPLPGGGWRSSGWLRRRRQGLLGTLLTRRGVLDEELPGLEGLLRPGKFLPQIGGVVQSRDEAQPDGGGTQVGGLPSFEDVGKRSIVRVVLTSSL